MAIEHKHILDPIQGLHRQTRIAHRKFMDDHGDRVEQYRRAITRGVSDAMSRFQNEIREISGDNRVCMTVVDEVRAYIDWLQWTLWDLPYPAVAVKPEPERFGHAAASCGIVYLSLRVMDDLLDRHFLYRGKHATLLSSLTGRPDTSEEAEGLTLLGGLLLMFEGLSRLVDPALQDTLDGPHTGLDTELAARMLRDVIVSVRRTVVGAIVEKSPPSDWDPEYYERMINLKNVDYWRGLYAAVDPGYSSPLYPFWERYYGLAQKLNDALNHARDVGRGQPNLVSIFTLGGHPSNRPCEAYTRVDPSPFSDVTHLFGADFLELGRLAGALPDLERGIALAKLHDSLEEAFRLGIFPKSSAARAVPGVAPQKPDDPRIPWDLHIRDIVERLGPKALETVPCPVCGAGETLPVLRKRGFCLERCQICGHIYVNPRLRSDLHERVTTPETDAGDPIFEIQKGYATFVCQLLKRHAMGPRLLDIGFGYGYLMQVARASGFHVFGIESSKALIDRMTPDFGNRLHRELIGDGTLPWGSFDVVVLSHVLEHFPDPRPVLRRIRESLNPNGLLYVVVPDMESAQFRIFGKRWQAISPLVHQQYFTEASLTRLMEASGLSVLERVLLPPPPAHLSPPRISHLFEEIGGSATGELALLVRRRDEDDA